jgi:hypothetical protein
MVIVGASDDQRKVLGLVVVAVPEGQLLVPVGRVMHGIQVERQVARRGVEGGDELVEDDAAVRGPEALRARARARGASG